MNSSEPTSAAMAIRNALVDVGRQIDAVLATAEAAAADIRAQAEQDAERYIEEKRMEANQVFA